jgi:hypothetical protein
MPRPRRRERIAITTLSLPALAPIRRHLLRPGPVPWQRTMRTPRDPQANPSTESAKQRGLGEEPGFNETNLRKTSNSGARHVPLLCSG